MQDETNAISVREQRNSMERLGYPPDQITVEICIPNLTLPVNLAAKGNMLKDGDSKSIILLNKNP